jgi:hypothetical protein
LTFIVGAGATGFAAAVIGATIGALTEAVAEVLFFFGDTSVVIPSPINPSKPVVLLDRFLSLVSLPPVRLLPASLLALLLPPPPGLSRGEVDAAKEATSAVATESLPWEEVVL